MIGSVRLVEIVGVVAALSAFLGLMLTSYQIVAFSDPMKWYTFARDFGESFGSVRLAYGFPLVQAVAIAWVGPFYGFLTNVPLLLILAFLVYVFSRQHADESGSADTHQLSPQLVGAGALSFMLAVNWKMWLHLASPYRDPLSHVFVLVSCLVLMRWVRRGRVGRAGLFAAGVALAFAAAARETAVLMLAPMALYVIANGRSWRDSLRDGVVLGLAVVVASIPLLVQNAMLSGNPVMPGQMLRGMEQEREFVPGIRIENLYETLPAVLDHLSAQYGWAALLVVGGMAVAIRRRMWVALALSLPAMLLHILFYGSYVRAVSRYLLIVDLFAAPLSGIAIAWLSAAGLRFVANPRTRERLRTAAIALAFVPGIAVSIRAASIEQPRFQLEQARELRADLLEILPPGAPLMGERPLAEILQCFVGDEVAVDHRSFTKSRLAASLDRNEVVYAVTHGRVGANITSGYDFKRIARIPKSRYRFGGFFLYEIRAIQAGHEPRSPGG